MILFSMGLAATGALLGVLSGQPPGAKGQTVSEALARVRAHTFHPVRDGFTFDRVLDQHGVANPDDPDWRVRTLAVRDLVRAGATGVPEIIAGLGDSDPHVRQGNSGDDPGADVRLHSSETSAATRCPTGFVNP